MKTIQSKRKKVSEVGEIRNDLERVSNNPSEIKDNLEKNRDSP